MSMHARIARVDDYSGALLQELEKLELERERGVLDRQQQEDFLDNLRKAVEAKDLRPMRHRAFLDGLVALLTVVGAALLRRIPPLLVGLGILFVFSLGLAAWRLVLYRRRYRHDRRWLGHLEGALTAGGTIFD
jgi:hypothetical protein